MSTKKTKTQPDPYPMTIETFRQIGQWALRGMYKDHPDCFNGIVQVEKFRVTVERIAEPVEVIAARLQKLWDESDNHHDYIPLEMCAKRLGITLTGSRGSKWEK